MTTKKLKLVILGATGNIGHVAAEELLKAGHEVRAVARTLENLAILERKGARIFQADLHDVPSVTEALEGADGAFLLIPPRFDAPDFRKYQDEAGEAIAQAVKRSGIPFVVSLSSVGAQHSAGTGPIAGLHLQEKRLNAIAGLSVIHLRPNYFMENLLSSIGMVKALGIYGSTLRPETRLDLVATRDIGLKVAELLQGTPAPGRRIVEFAGPESVSQDEVTRALGEAIGKPDLKYVRFSIEDARQAMRGAGLPADLVELYLEMNQGADNGLLRPETPFQAGNRGRISVREFARSTWAPAYAAWSG